MSKQDEEIDDAEIDEEETSEEDEDTEDESDEDSEEDESEDDDSDDDDSDDEDDKPLTRKDLKAILAKEANRRHASQRDSSKKRDLPDKKRSGSSRAENERLDRIEADQRKLAVLETKRQFGYANGLAPDEVDVVFRLSKKPTAKTLKDPIVKGALDGYRADKRLKTNVPSGNGRPLKLGGKDSKDLTPQERSTRLVSRRQEILDRKQGRRG